MNYKIKMTGSLLMVVVILASMISCDGFKAADPLIIHNVEIKDVSRDTIISIFNEKLSTKVQVAFEETLSDTAIVQISSDTLFSQHGTKYLLPVRNAPLMYIGGLLGDSLFIKYRPINVPISGNVKIKLTF
jgi:hypothetical protein